jgi:hypothetical protein
MSIPFDSRMQGAVTNAVRRRMNKNAPVKKNNRASIISDFATASN